MARGRKPGFRMTEAHRDKIRNSNILSALINHVEGKQDMSSTQVTAGLGLLRKVMPDMTTAEITGANGGPVKTEEVGGAAKVLAALDRIAERSRAAGEPDAE